MSWQSSSGTADTDSWIVVEGGGSRTTVMVSGPTPGQADGESTNPRSVGAPQALQTLGDLVAEALAASGTSADAVTFAVAAHGAASTRAAADEFAELFADALRRSGVAAPLAVTGDILPLLFGTEAEVAVAVIVGTGTDFLARRGTDRFAAASGLDYLLTDEGGGFDLGLRGLRAVTRALDGRGPATLLTELAGAWCDAPPSLPLRDFLFQQVYAAPARPVVASFARFVVGAAERGDPIAEGLVDDAVGEVLTGVHAVLRGVGAADPPHLTAGDGPLRLVLSGSLATTDNNYRDRLLARVAADLPDAVVMSHGAEALVPAVRRLGELLLRQRDDLDRLRQAGPAVFLG